MRVKVNQDLCIGCGMCVSVCSDFFSMSENSKALAKEDFSDDLDDELKNEIKECEEFCPVSAIEITE